MGTKKGIVLGILLSITSFAGSAVAADPSYLIYPGTSAVFEYDTSRYEVVTDTQDPRFDPAFAIAGQVLWDRVNGVIPADIYHARDYITGFRASSDGLNHFVVSSNDFDVIVDGFSTTERTLGQLCLRFLPYPATLSVQVEVDAIPLLRLVAPLDPVQVTTPLADGYFGGTGVHHVRWLGAHEIQILAFSDKNADGTFEGTPAYSIIAKDIALPVETTTWGGVKALYR